MRTSEELELAAYFMRAYATKCHDRLVEDGMAPLWDTDVKYYSFNGHINKLRRAVSRRNVADQIAENLERGVTAEDMLRDWMRNLSDTPVYLAESGDEMSFWNEYRMEVNFNNWLLGLDWPTYCQMFHDSNY